MKYSMKLNTKSGIVVENNRLLVDLVYSFHANDVIFHSYKVMGVGCENVINMPTRYGSTSQTILDHVITNQNTSKISSGVLDYAITDHLPIFAIIHSKSSKNNNTEKKDIYWQKIDDAKKDIFLSNLEKSLSKLDLTDHPKKTFCLI